MERNVDFKEISDGKLYGSNDMVKADCNGCKGCSACCRGMGHSIVLDPLDVHRLSAHLQQSFEELLAEHIELNVVDGVILPNLKMSGPTESCSFLDEEGRCRIHAIRPGICRLFPLGRFYENEGFRYFLQVHECPMPNKTKVKVKKWIDTPELKRNETFVNEWHYFLKELQKKLKESEEESVAKNVSMYILQNFYMNPFERGEDFYEQFEARLQGAGMMMRQIH
ncbi:YkgJ family cysteine cluster protein [Hespellia stercorisuis]|uniref:YkgJ family cysteine cluster protein n=1 Tax=Hespellia stercorisuis DSM 15480 TaxID=1121950 RepID=A0A1M6JW35_9FIRM|nr:YkgJ family cysteine cluster protein [Hespellia stercorisuis]SHJ50882.1 hypothetical protein SAMN02745243_00748 [Hespellia stercorisuis DSM 15480]